jgi:hypothetical protein
MTNVTETTTYINAITRDLETRRNDLSIALAKPKCSGGVSGAERTRLSELHRRITKALSALHGEARDW